MPRVTGLAPAPDADARVRAMRGLRAVAANPTANVDAMSRRAGAFVALKTVNPRASDRDVTLRLTRRNALDLPKENLQDLGGAIRRGAGLDSRLDSQGWTGSRARQRPLIRGLFGSASPSSARGGRDAGKRATAASAPESSLGFALQGGGSHEGHFRAALSHDLQPRGPDGLLPV